MKVLLITCVFSLMFSVTNWAVQFPKYDVKQYTKSLKVVSVPIKDSAVFMVRMMVLGGANIDEIGYEGSMSLMLDLVSLGSKNYPNEQFLDKINQEGASFLVSLDSDTTTFGINSLSRNKDLMIDMFEDAIKNPQFPKKEYDRIVRQYKSNLESRYTDNNWIISSFLNDNIYKDSPKKGRILTSQSLSNISHKMMTDLHQNLLTKHEVVLLVLGEFDPDWLDKQVKSRFVPLFNHDVTSLKRGKSKQTDSNTYFIHKPKQTQVSLSMMMPTVPISHPDYTGLRVLNYILGAGGFSSRLGESIRAQKGLTYSIYSQLKSTHDSGFHYITTFTRNSEVQKLLAAVNDEVALIVKDGVTKKELDDAKAFYKGNLAIYLSDPNNYATSFLNALYKGLTIEQLVEKINEIQTVSLVDINKLAKRYFDFYSPTVMILGDKTVLKEDISNLKTKAIYYYKDPLPNQQVNK